MRHLLHWHKPVMQRTPSQHPFLLLQNDLDKTIHDFYDLLNISEDTSKALDDLLIVPAIDVVEDDDQLKIEIEMSGVDEKDIDVSISDNVLKVKAEKSMSKKNVGKKYISREIGYGHYEKNMSLPDYVDTGKAKVTFKKGMVWVVFPKKSGATAAHQLKVEKASEK